jgi:hypothetical protein
MKSVEELDCEGRYLESEYNNLINHLAVTTIITGSDKM